MGSYHLWDYDWTPLSQNPCWNHTTILSLRVALRISCKNTSIVRLRASKLYGTEWNGSVIAIVCRRLKVKEGLYEYELACSSESLRFSLSFWLKFLKYFIFSGGNLTGMDLRGVAGVLKWSLIGGKVGFSEGMPKIAAWCRIYDEFSAAPIFEFFEFFEDLTCLVLSCLEDLGLGLGLGLGLAFELRAQSFGLRPMAYGLWPTTYNLQPTTLIGIDVRINETTHHSLTYEFNLAYLLWFDSSRIMNEWTNEGRMNWIDSFNQSFR